MWIRSTLLVKATHKQQSTYMVEAPIVDQYTMNDQSIQRALFYYIRDYKGIAIRAIMYKEVFKCGGCVYRFADDVLFSFVYVEYMD